MANKTLKTFLAGYGIKKVSDIESMSKQSPQTLRNWYKNKSKKALIECCVLAYRLRVQTSTQVNQEFNTEGLGNLSSYLERYGYKQAQFERMSNQSYQTLSNWFMSEKKRHMIGIIRDAVEWTRLSNSDESQDKIFKSFSLEDVVKNRKGFKGKYY